MVVPRAVAIRPAQCPSAGAGLVPPYEDGGPYASGARAGSVPPDVAFDTVLWCSSDDGLSQPDGTIVDTITELSAEPSPALSAALELGDEPPPNNPSEVCPANATPVLYLLLVDDSDTAYRPRIPLTWCGIPRPEVTAAVDDHSWTTVRRYRLPRDPNG